MGMKQEVLLDMLKKFFSEMPNMYNKAAPRGHSAPYPMQNQGQ
jgi:hypothetical protein